jgi:DNA-directed RNA polymerase I, II, and III subunit RPABC1
LKSQGYNVSNYEGSGINEVNSMFLSNQLGMLLTKNDQSKKVYITYHLEKTLSHKNIGEYIDDLYIDNVLKKNDDLIIIMKDEPNESLIKIIKNIWEQDHYYINIFNIKRLQFNILKHELVPRHSILTNEEVNEIKNKYNITDVQNQLPDISRFDPVAQAICIRPGQICKIERPSKTAIISVYYRVCSA